MSTSAIRAVIRKPPGGEGVLIGFQFGSRLSRTLVQQLIGLLGQADTSQLGRMTHHFSPSRGEMAIVTSEPNASLTDAKNLVNFFGAQLERPVQITIIQFDDVVVRVRSVEPDEGSVGIVLRLANRLKAEEYDYLFESLLSWLRWAEDSVPSEAPCLVLVAYRWQPYCIAVNTTREKLTENLEGWAKDNGLSSIPESGEFLPEDAIDFINAQMIKLSS